jgi:hypothetical protein
MVPQMLALVTAAFALAELLAGRPVSRHVRMGHFLTAMKATIP